MKHLKLFEAHNSKVNELLDGISPDFWKMVNTAKWWLVINAGREFYNKVDTQGIKKEAEKRCKARIYTNYEYERVKHFHDEMHILYKRLHEYFKPYWLGEKKLPGYRDGYSVSDDGYWDLLSSVIGKGKLWVIKCIKDPSLPAEMVKTHNYAENFSYLLNVDKNDYDEIRFEFDPLYRETEKYNL